MLMRVEEGDTVQGLDNRMLVRMGCQVYQLVYLILTQISRDYRLDSTHVILGSRIELNCN